MSEAPVLEAGKRPRPPESEAAAEKRRLIVRTAALLFADRGYHQTSMIDIADATDLRKPTLYHYFSGKEEILFLIHEEMIDDVIDFAERRLAESTMTVSEMLTETMVDIIEQLDLHPGHAQVIFEYYRELPKDQREGVNTKRDRYFATVQRLVELGVERGEFEVPDARMATMLIFGACNWTYQWYHQGGGLTPRDIGESFAALFLNGIVTSPGKKAPAKRPAAKAKR